MGLQFTPGAGQTQQNTEIQATGTVVQTADEQKLNMQIEEAKNFNIVVKTD
ncbi:MAG: hypothetical protein KIG62_02585 [Oscillospiraceae bacterium]|nr:hypothetical protein [Oscillospiraceae bacterium]